MALVKQTSRAVARFLHLVMPVVICLEGNGLSRLIEIRSATVRSAMNVSQPIVPYGP